MTAYRVLLGEKRWQDIIVRKEKPKDEDEKKIKKSGKQRTTKPPIR